MRIATFNIENLDEPVAPRARVLRPALERLEADVLCLQEVHSQKQPNTSNRTLAALDELLAGTPYATYHRASTLSERHGGASTVHNLVTLSRLPIKATRQVHHDIVPPLELEPVTAALVGARIKF